jgi:hypothetical protein
MIMAKTKKLFVVWEADRVTGEKVTAVVERVAVSAAQARNFYRHEMYEGQAFDYIPNLIMAEEILGVNQAFDPPPTPKAIPERPEIDCPDMFGGTDPREFFDPTPRRRKR